MFELSPDLISQQNWISAHSIVDISREIDKLKNNSWLAGSWFFWRIQIELERARLIFEKT